MKCNEWLCVNCIQWTICSDHPKCKQVVSENRGGFNYIGTLKHNTHDGHVDTNLIWWWKQKSDMKNSRSPDRWRLVDCLYRSTGYLPIFTFLVACLSFQISLTIALWSNCMYHKQLVCGHPCLSRPDRKCFQLLFQIGRETQDTNLTLNMANLLAAKYYIKKYTLPVG